MLFASKAAVTRSGMGSRPATAASGCGYPVLRREVGLGIDAADAHPLVTRPGTTIPYPPPGGRPHDLGLEPDGGVDTPAGCRRLARVATCRTPFDPSYRC
jgi:hypothetical protein